MPTPSLILLSLVFSLTSYAASKPQVNPPVLKGGPSVPAAPGGTSPAKPSQPNLVLPWSEPEILRAILQTEIVQAFLSPSMLAPIEKNYGVSCPLARAVYELKLFKGTLGEDRFEVRGSCMPKNFSLTIGGYLTKGKRLDADVDQLKFGWDD